MTIDEIHASILLEIDRVGNYSTSGLTSEEVDDYIDDAVDEFIDAQRAQIRQYRYSVQGVEAQENLRTIINRESITNIVSPNVLSDGWAIDISNLTDYDYFVSGTAEFSSTETLRFVPTAYLTDVQRIQYMNLFKRGVPISVESNQIIGVLPEDPTVSPSEATISYLQYPQSVDLDTGTGVNLPNHTHRDIVDIAATKIKQSLSGQVTNRNDSQGNT